MGGGHVDYTKQVALNVQKHPYALPKVFLINRTILIMILALQNYYGPFNFPALRPSASYQCVSVILIKGVWKIINLCRLSYALKENKSSAFV